MFFCLFVCLPQQQCILTAPAVSFPHHERSLSIFKVRGVKHFLEGHIPAVELQHCSNTHSMLCKIIIISLMDLISWIRCLFRVQSKLCKRDQTPTSSASKVGQKTVLSICQILSVVILLLDTSPWRRSVCFVYSILCTWTCLAVNGWKLCNFSFHWLCLKQNSLLLTANFAF